MLRLGLCCTFLQEPIKFRTTTAAYLQRLKERGEDPLTFLAELIAANIAALGQAVDYCAQRGIGSFRVNSQFLPLYTHPSASYTLEDLPGGGALLRNLSDIGSKRNACGLRLTFHPDQFVVLNSPHAAVVQASLAELEYQAMVAGLIGADVICIHGGGVYGDKNAALQRLRAVLKDLSPNAYKLLAFENDDKSYTPRDLLPLCEECDLPFIYDVHHHRCCRDNWTEEQVTRLACASWNREPLFHLSSPLGGWESKKPLAHADFIDARDVPSCWLDLTAATIEVEAKAKESAVEQLRQDLTLRGVSLWTQHAS